MANKKSNKKKVQAKAEPKAATTQVAKAEPKKAAAPAKKASKPKKTGKPGIFSRVKSYLGSVRSEMKRVVWPTKQELINYSVAVCASLIVVGVIIALLDAVIGTGLVAFAGLRG